jgi:hypothetical protein
MTGMINQRNVVYIFMDKEMMRIGGMYSGEIFSRTAILVDMVRSYHIYLPTFCVFTLVNMQQTNFRFVS